KEKMLEDINAKICEMLGNLDGSRISGYGSSQRGSYLVCGKKERTECLLCTKAAKDENKQQVLFITAGDHKNAAARNVWKQEISKKQCERTQQDSKRKQQER
ncbi:hypothetical protein Tco_1488354, partial [Tanacetum coccineum]